jgi:arabinofuranosyltransferase
VPPTSSTRALVYLPALVIYLLLAWKLEFLCDDAFISFRYAKNFAAGEGLRYNLTLGPPVEGYSNFLWVVGLALANKLGFSSTAVAPLASALAGALLVWLVTRRAALLAGIGTLGAVTSGLFFASLPPVCLWASGGLATLPTALCIFACYDRLLGEENNPRGLQAGVWAGLAALLRADAAVWIAMLLVAGGLLWLLSNRPRNLCRALWQTALVLAVVVVLHIAWRQSYYGDWLPNTARVKAGFSLHRLFRGFDYIVAFLLGLPAILGVLLFSLRRWPRRLANLWLPSALVIVGSLAYACWVGGDFMPMGRFLMPAVPFSALLFAGLWAQFSESGKSTKFLWPAIPLLALASNIGAAFDYNLLPDSWRSRFHFRQDRQWESELSMRAGMAQRAQEWSIEGRALARVTSPGETMSAGAIGALGYYSHLEIYDHYGLVTPMVIAAAIPRESASPGHDLRVDTTFFTPLKPTYAGSLLAPMDAPTGYDLFANWDQHPFSRIVTMEHYPLLPSDGGQPGWELRLLRYRR